jgi:uncharacterized membrane protein YgdD (TMEM256/DUF423 family)
VQGRQLLGVGAVFAFFGVALGAFGAHALRDRLSTEMLAIYQTGVQYQMIHALAMVALGAQERVPVRVTGWLFAVGVVVFSGSLYALALTGIRMFGAITPLGGLAFLIGWAILAVKAFGRRRENSTCKTRQMDE